jgi:signal transduction histidine kinase
MDTQTNGLYLTLIASLVFLTVLLVLFMLSMLKHLRLRLKSYKQQLTREIELIDTERSRISADLHDELGSGLAAVGLLLRQAAESADSIQLRKATTHLQSQQQKIREISHDLLPRVLETHGLEIALIDLYEEIRSAGNIGLKVKGLLPPYTWLPGKNVHFYRIIRELLTNALKHARASQINITMEQVNQKLIVNIHDDGIGFNIQKQKLASAGLGLQNLASRVVLLDAHMEFRSTVQKGTTCEITIPLRAIVTGYAK